MTAHTDIRAGGWVARLPAAWRPYVLLARFDRPIGIWLLLLPGWWAIAMTASDAATGVRLALLFALGAAAMRGAGCVVNDLWDRDLDRQVARTRARPLAAGTLRRRQALTFLVVLCAIGLVVLLQLPPLAVAFGALSLLPVVLYPLAKRVTDWPQAVLGLTFSWAAPEGVAAATGALGIEAWLLWAAAFCWILGYDTIYAHQDRADDAMIGNRSSAVRLGARTAPFVGVCYAALLALLVAAGAAAGLGWAFYAGLLPAAALLAWQVRTLDIDDPAGCLRRFRSNREVGLLIAAACLLGRW